MKVHRLEFARGVNIKMLDLVRQWAKNGPFEIAVAKYGGLRTNESDQALLSGGGMSAAKGLIKTPHGRGAALDLCPLEFLSFVPTAFGGTARRWTSWDGLPAEVREKFTVIGKFSEALGYTWGGRWVGGAYPNGDQPHHELKGWQSLPFPAKAQPFPEDLEQMLPKPTTIEL